MVGGLGRIRKGEGSNLLFQFHVAQGILSSSGRIGTALGLTTERMIELETRKLGYTEGLSGLIDLIGKVHSAMVLRPSAEKRGAPSL